MRRSDIRISGLDYDFKVCNPNNDKYTRYLYEREHGVIRVDPRYRDIEYHNTITAIKNAPMVAIGAVVGIVNAVTNIGLYNVTKHILDEIGENLIQDSFETNFKDVKNTGKPTKSNNQQHNNNENERKMKERERQHKEPVDRRVDRVVPEKESEKNSRTG